MKSLRDFCKITIAEEYFEFFGLEYDESLVNVKRFHIMRKFGEMVQKAQSVESDEAKLLEFYKFALISVYKSFEGGYSPSAADVWNMYEKTGGCLACSTASSCSTEVSGNCSSDAGFNPSEAEG